MSAKQMKRIRKIFKDRGYNILGSANYKDIEHRKTVYYRDNTGELKSGVAVKKTVLNTTKLEYRRMKKFLNKNKQVLHG